MLVKAPATDHDGTVTMGGPTTEQRRMIALRRPSSLADLSWLYTIHQRADMLPRRRESGRPEVTELEYARTFGAGILLDFIIAERNAGIWRRAGYVWFYGDEHTGGSVHLGVIADRPADRPWSMAAWAGTTAAIDHAFDTEPGLRAVRIEVAETRARHLEPTLTRLFGEPGRLPEHDFGDLLLWTITRTDWMTTPRPRAWRPA